MSPPSTHFLKCWGEASALLRHWFQYSVLKNIATCAVDFGCLKWVQAGISCVRGVVDAGTVAKADDNWNMKICNKKQNTDTP